MPYESFEKPEAVTTAAAPMPDAAERRRRRLRRVLFIAGPLLVLVVAAILYFTGGGRVSTDNAYVQADMVTVSADVSGPIVSVEVRENQHVDRGDVLFKIDARPYQVALARAEAQLQSARNQVASLKANYRQLAEQLQLDGVNEAFARREFDRQNQLAAGGYATKQKLDAAKHTLDVARQQTAMAKEQQQQIVAQLGGTVDAPAEDTPIYKAALAARDAAALDVERTTVRAPFAGVASKKPDLGQYVAAGSPVTSIVADTGMWIDANFKETDLTHMAAGQPVTISIDAYPDYTWRGTVDSISQASGAEFSVLPPQNATGNWVKVVQRIPVRIAVEKQPGAPQLRAGMSANVEVVTGQKRSLSSLIP